MLRKKIGKIHTLAECQDCGWQTGAHTNGQALAAIHAKTHKHKVRGEVGLAFEYDGREE